MSSNLFLFSSCFATTFTVFFSELASFSWCKWGNRSGVRKDSLEWWDVLSRSLSTFVYALSYRVAKIPAPQLFFHILLIFFTFENSLLPPPSSSFGRALKRWQIVPPTHPLWGSDTRRLRNLCSNGIHVIFIAESVGDHEFLREAKANSNLAIPSHSLYTYDSFSKTWLHQALRHKFCPPLRVEDFNNTLRFFLPNSALLNRSQPHRWTKRATVFVFRTFGLSATVVLATQCFIKPYLISCMIVLCLSSRWLSSVESCRAELCTVIVLWWFLYFQKRF